VEIEETISARPTPEAAGRGPQPPLLRAARSLADRPRWETGNRAFADIVQLTRNYQLSAYDAAYLELAIHRGLPLACLDGKLKTAAATAGVVLFSPP